MQFSKLLFPHESIRPVQEELIKFVSKCLEDKKNLIVHAPTGMGKTAATISPAINFALDKDLTIFFLTSRHTQHKIVIDTLKQIKNKNNANFIATSIIGKKFMCGQENVTSMPSGDFIEFCKSLREEKKCEFYLNVNSKNINCKFVNEEIEKSSPLVVEELVEKSINARVCPYEIALMQCAKSKVIISDYNYIFNSSIRELLFKKTNKSLDKSIIIIDEGHNIPERIRELMTKKISTIIIKRAIKEAKQNKIDDVIPLLVDIQEALNNLSNNLRNNEEKIIKKDDFVKEVSKNKNYVEIYEAFYKAAEIVVETKKQSFIGNIGSFLEEWQKGEVGFARILSRKEFKTVLAYRCLDPSLIIKEVIQSAYSTILMSGTLTPTIMYKDLLGFDNETLLKEFPSPFPKQNKLTMIIPRTTTKFTFRNDKQYSEIGKICSEIVNSIKGCIAIFFPSYELRDQIGDFIVSTCNKSVLLENPNISKLEKQELMDKLKSYKNSGAVLLAVTSGSFGEGVDLPGVLKCVIVVGLPLNKPDLETKQLIDYYDKKFSKGWEYGYVMPAMIKCFQNAGRCIRSETDKGVIFFLDERYTWQQYFKYFPSDWNIKITLNYKEELKKFFE